MHWVLGILHSDDKRMSHSRDDYSTFFSALCLKVFVSLRPLRSFAAQEVTWHGADFSPCVAQPILLEFYIHHIDLPITIRPNGIWHDHRDSLATPWRVALD